MIEKHMVTYRKALKICWKHVGSMLEPCWKHAVCCLRAGMPACQRVSACLHSSVLVGFPGWQVSQAGKTDYPGKLIV